MESVFTQRDEWKRFVVSCRDLFYNPLETRGASTVPVEPFAVFLLALFLELVLTGSVSSPGCYDVKCHVDTETSLVALGQHSVDTEGCYTVYILYITLAFRTFLLDGVWCHWERKDLFFHDEVMKCRDEHERNTPWPRPLDGSARVIKKNCHKRMHTQVTIFM